MIGALAFLGGYVVLTGVGSCLEKPVSGKIDAFQLNVAIRAGVLVLGIGALLATSHAALPSLPSLLVALVIGVIAGTGSVSYCYAVDHLPVWLVVSIANTYILITVALGVLILHEGLSLLGIVGLVLAVGGVLLLSVRPRAAVSSGGQGSGASAVPLVSYGVLATNIVLVGVATFLEKPALEHGLQPLQLNAFESAGTLAVALLALLLRREVVPPSSTSWAGLGLGAAFGLAAIFYFLGLRQLPVSVAAPVSNSYVVLTVLLSAVFLGETLNWRRIGGIGLTLAGVVILAAFTA